MQCERCGSILQDGDYDVDKTGRGFWCEVCDMYNYLPSASLDSRHRFELYLENNAGTNETNDTGVKLRQHVSPLRYPGGKTKLIKHAYSRLNPGKTRLFVEPFAGGASVGLSLLEAGAIEKLHLNDLDFGIYSLFSVIFSDPSPLLYRLNHIMPTRDMYFESQGRLLGEHKHRRKDIQQAAWDMLLVNRLSYSGIVKAHPLGGKEGPQEALLARWNPTTLSARIERLWPLRAFVSVTNRDALEVIEENYWNECATLFIDPPYVAKGPALYNKAYGYDDHIDLCVLLESLYSTCPGADVQLYYDNDNLVRDIYSLPEVIVLNRQYCV